MPGPSAVGCPLSVRGRPPREGGWGVLPGESGSFGRARWSIWFSSCTLAAPTTPSAPSGTQPTVHASSSHFVAFHSCGRMHPGGARSLGCGRIGLGIGRGRRHQCVGQRLEFDIGADEPRQGKRSRCGQRVAATLHVHAPTGAIREPPGPGWSHARGVVPGHVPGHDLDDLQRRPYLDTDGPSARRDFPRNRCERRAGASCQIAVTTPTGDRTEPEDVQHRQPSYLALDRSRCLAFAQRHGNGGNHQRHSHRDAGICHVVDGRRPLGDLRWAGNSISSH
jgi:hypothetical protein